MKNQLEQAHDKNAPTPERMRRHRFRKEGAALRLWTTVARLRDAGDIGDDEVAAAQRWRAEFDYAERGVVETSLSDYPGEKGDIHTWMLGRGKCAARLRRMRELMGDGLHSRIEMLLVREMRFSDMAHLIFPDDTRAQARTKTAAQCALALEWLSEYYKNKNLQK
ncbi:hypothetical protein [Asaia sp. As-1742]|uniref:hypothetical protein n=1 Tax=Asaia sp. As-1742 TaxID=2608325 RepID=UPI00141E9981|nr:hypothetical protein [Asaia sp. As-1742]NIE79234.1 hypothetical protein [Asaia sp. As-1742]